MIDYAITGALIAAETRDDAGRGTGTEVTAVKNAKLQEHYDELGIANAVQRKRSFYREGAVAGQSAGDKVPLHRPVSEDTGPLQIAAT